jgi:Tfp pilus assembly protein PilF
MVASVILGKERMKLPFVRSILIFIMIILAGCAGRGVKDTSKVPYPDRITLATIYRQSGETERAKDVLKNAIKREPDRPEAYIDMGDMLFMEDDLEGAASNYHNAVESGSEDPVMLNNYAWVMTNLGEHGKALSLADRAINMAPKPLYPYLDTRAMVLKFLGNTKEALISAELAMALTPDHDVAMRQHLEKLIEELKNHGASPN